MFVLEEFDMFARKPKQTLLYNLLDAMQAADMQVRLQKPYFFPEKFACILCAEPATKCKITHN